MLLTGASGRVGGILRSFWSGDKYELRLADIRPIGHLTDVHGAPVTRGLDNVAAPLQPHESFVHCNASRLDDFLTACQGIDVVVHLAADPSPDADFETPCCRGTSWAATTRMPPPRKPAVGASSLHPR